MAARPRKRPARTEPPLDEDEHLVFRSLRTLLVSKTRLEAAVERPGAEDELVSYRVHADVLGREAALLVRIMPGERPYACWTLQNRKDKYHSFLNTFDAFQA